MKKLFLIAIFCLSATAAFGQCNGVFPANTLCGNLSGTPQPPAAFSASTSLIGPGSSTVNGLALWGNTTGNQFKDGNGQTVLGSYTFGSGSFSYNQSPAYVPQIISFQIGSNATPTISLGPVVGITRVEALVNQNTNTLGGQTGTLVLSNTGNNTSTTFNTQTNGLLSTTIQNGTGDAVSGYFASTMNGGPTLGGTHQAVGVFAVGTAGSVVGGASAFAIQLAIFNNTAADQNVGAGYATGWTSGIDLASEGAHKATSGIDFRNGGATFDAGIWFQANSVTTNIIDIRTSAQTILLVVPNMSYTNGIDLGIAANNDTYSSFAFRSPGFLVDGFGNTTGGTLVLTSGTPVTTAGKVSFGATTTASSSCGTLAGAAGCLEINVGGTSRFVPFY
jgi:hypothetical protein